MTTNTQQLSYNEYIQSDAWKQHKEDFFATHDKECSACGSTEALDVHHKTYERLGAEVDNDLVVMCETCHAQYHAIFRHASVTDSENFVAVKHASREGKVLFQKYKQIIDSRLLHPMGEYKIQMAKLATIVNDPTFELMSVKQKDEVRSFAGKIGDLFNDFYCYTYMYILEMENPHIGRKVTVREHYTHAYYDANGEIDPKGELKRNELKLLLKYRWLSLEITSLIPTEGTLSELQKIKKILATDDINQSVIASGYRKKKTYFIDRLFGFSS